MDYLATWQDRWHRRIPEPPLDPPEPEDEEPGDEPEPEDEEPDEDELKEAQERHRRERQGE